MKPEHYKLLCENRQHYLWNKVYSYWTEEDIENLKKGVNRFTHGTKAGHGMKQAVIAIKSNGETQEFESVAECARITGICATSIYGVVNGKFRMNDITFVKKQQHGQP